MKIRTSRTATLFGAAIIALGCGSGGDEPSDVSAAEVKKQASETVDAAMDYAAKKKEEFVARANRVAADAEGELDRARQQLAEVPEESREQLEEAIDRTAAARDALRSEIEELQRSGADSWDTAKQRISAALDEMAEARAEIAAALTAGSAEDASS